jgi:predicted dehydrogenase
MEALQRLGVRLSAVCDFDEDKAQAVASKWSIPHVFGGKDYRKLIQCEDVDVVHIASPNRYHHAMALAAIEAGKHCVCEKPLAMNTKETAQLVKATRASKRVFAVNYNVRFYPAVLQMRAMAQRGDLGDIIHVNGSYLQDWLLLPTDYNWRLLAREGGMLRAVADIGTHWMDTVSFVLGSPIQSVLAHLETFHKTRKRPLGEVQTFTTSKSRQRYESYPVRTEDFASVMLRFKNGAHGNLAVSQVAAGRRNCIRVEVYGSKQSVWWNSEEPDYLHIGRREGGNITSHRATPGFAEDVAGFTDYPPGHAEGFPDTFKMLARAVYSDIQGRRSRRPLYATAEDGHQEVKVCEAIQRSHQSKRWVKV